MANVLRTSKVRVRVASGDSSTQRKSPVFNYFDDDVLHDDKHLYCKVYSDNFLNMTYDIPTCGTWPG